MAVTPNRIYTTLTSRGLHHDTLPMRLYHKAKKLGTWDPRDIDLTQDRLDWLRLSEDHQGRLRNLVISFQAGEEAVTLDLLPLIMTIAREGRLEEEMFLTTFLWEEAKHTEFFRRVLDEVLQEKDDLHMITSPSPSNGRDLFADVLPREMNRLLTDPSPENQVRASILYNMIVEGVLAETGYYSYSRLLSESGMMPGLLQGIQLIKRDESRHIAYGVFLISRLVAADQSLWPIVENRMNELFSSIERDQQKNGTVEPVRLFARQQFEKRLARISRAREQSVEQIYRSTESEEAAESEAEGPGLAGHNA
ncbi:MAG TPA: R2-like ligand-binding oxidase [Ktedonobacteraceae bacterium]|jgi:ribonucleoside-diphosphate reductase beta chain|nr:R2-like ligand-binding oxidase [Ktedonobacteraceae bacterium]